MKESLHFVYDGVSSRDMKCMQAHLGNSKFYEEEVFLPEKRILEEKVRGRDEPYFYGVEYEPLSLPISIYFPYEMTDKDVRKFCRWIDQDYYKELYFETNPNKKIYAMFEGESKILHKGIKQDAIVIFNMRTNSPFSYSPVYTSEVYDLSQNGDPGYNIIFINLGDLPYSPVMHFEMVGDGDIRIVNMSNGGQEFKMTGLAHGERIQVDCHYQDIIMDIPGMYRYDNHNRVYLEIIEVTII